MAKGRSAFDPQRLSDTRRPVAVVPQIVDAPAAPSARGFTEVKIIGVGGGGSNAVNRMIEAGVQGVEFIAVNTDAQALAMSNALKKIQIGGRSTRGLGAGGDPQQGERAAEITGEALHEAIAGADMVFITAGLGGGTGTGASPVIAEMAREQRALTVGIVTLPFGFEGYRRKRNAEEGLQLLKERVDALIVIPNDRLLAVAHQQLSVVEAFRLADDTLRQGVQGISDLVTMTGLINLDFADVRSVMTGAGTALMAIGEGKGEGRALAAVNAAINSPLLDTSIEGATNVLLNITGGPDLSLAEVTDAADAIAQLVDPSANIFFGAVIHPKQQSEIKITVIATGLKAGTSARPSIASGAAPRREPQPSPRYPSPESAEPPDDLDLPSFLRRRRP